MLVVSVMTAAMTVARLVSVEVLGGTVPPVLRPVAVMRVFAVVAVIRMVVVVDIALEMLWAVKPWAGADKNAASKPLGTVVAVGSAAIRRGIVVTVGTNRGHTDSDADLGLCSGSTYRNAESGDGDQKGKFYFTHRISSLLLEGIGTGKLRSQTVTPAGPVAERLP
jgi:hypothetical protein